MQWSVEKAFQQRTCDDCRRLVKISTKCWICNKVYVGNDVKIRDHCLVTGKYNGFAHGDLISILY